MCPKINENPMTAKIKTTVPLLEGNYGTDTSVICMCVCLMEIISEVANTKLLRNMIVYCKKKLFNCILS